MTDHGSASVMSELESSVAPAPVVTSQRGDIDMTELEPSGSQPCDETTYKESTNDERTGNEKNGDQLSGIQPSSNQPNSDQPIDDQPVGDQLIDDQPMCDQSTDDQPRCDQSTDYQPNGDQLTDDQPMDHQPTDNKSTDAAYTDILLIAEVQKSQFIFSGDYKEYCDKVAIRKEWEIVCEGLFPQWSTLTPAKKKTISREVQNKWTKIRKPFFKTYAGIHKRLTRITNDQHAADFFNALGAQCELDIKRAETYAQEHVRNHQEENARKDQNASYSYDEYTRKEQNASREEEHVHGMNPIPEKVPLAEILEQPVVPSTSAQFNENQGHISVIPTAAVPSTSAQFNENQGHMPEMQTTFAPNNQGQNDLVMPSPGADRSICCASFLYAMFRNLDYDQQSAVWPNLIALLTNASKSKPKPKKIKILQGELLNPGDWSATRMPATGTEIIIQGPFTDPELEGQEPFAGPELVVEAPFADPELVARDPFVDPGLVAQEPFADPELGNQQTLAEKRVDQETMTELEDTEEECIYPSSYGRPTNAQGEIIYPETDQEDLDEE